MNEAFLDINFSKLYPEFQLQAELRVDEGEFFSLVGPSGCGKTTLLRLIAGLEEPADGFIKLNGFDITSFSPAKRRVGLVFQEYALFPHLTVEENIEYGLKILIIPFNERKKRLKELLSVFELENLAKRQIEQLSGGERQRVAFARALAPEPLVLLLDEPFSALDYSLRRHLQRELRQKQKELRFTTIFVTHQQEEALALSDRLAVMQNGKILQTGTPRKVYENPVNQFVAGFLGETNLISCRLEKEVNQVKVWFDDETTLYLSPIEGIDNGEYYFSVRPEDIIISSEEELLFKGRLQTVEFFGTHYRLEIMAGKKKITAFIGKKAGYFKEGMQINIGFAISGIKLFPVIEM